MAHSFKYNNVCNAQFDGYKLVRVEQEIGRREQPKEKLLQTMFLFRCIVWPTRWRAKIIKVFMLGPQHNRCILFTKKNKIIIKTISFSLSSTEYDGRSWNPSTLIHCPGRREPFSANKHQRSYLLTIYSPNSCSEELSNDHCPTRCDNTKD